MPSYEKSKSSGLWSVRFRETVDGREKNKRLSGFKTKKDAQYGYEDYVAAQKFAVQNEKEIKPPDPQNITFDRLLEQYIEFKKPRIKETSFYDIEKKLRLRILPFFSGMIVKEILPTTILEWQKTISGYSYAYQKNLMTHLTMIFNFGERYLDIKNVVKKVDKPRNLEPKKEMLYWSPEEFAAFIAQVDRPAYEMFFRFLYLSGCRLGEALALSWDDINLETGNVSITKSVSHKARENGKSYKVTTPKNEGSNRVISLPHFFCAQLIEYRNTFDKFGPFVFGGVDPLPPSTVSRTLRNAAAAAGVKAIRVHDIRHSCASLLIHKGVSIVAVSRHLGHTSVKQTLDTYSHMLPDDRTMILNAINSIESKIGISNFKS